MNKRKSFFKGSIGMMLCLSMLIGFSGNVFAAKDDKKFNENTSSYSRAVTREQAMQRVMAVNNVSSTKAEAILKDAEAKASEKITTNNRLSIVELKTLSSSYYTEFILNHDFGGGFTVEAGCLMLISRHTSGHEMINSIVTDWTIASGSGNYTWGEAYRISELQGTNTAYMRARGAIEVAVDTSAQGGVEYKNELLGVGFSISTQIGKTYYLRKVQTWEGTYYHPFI